MHSTLRAAVMAGALASAGAANAQTLTLQDAIARAVTASPQGAAEQARTDVLNAARDAAATRPAASVTAYVENVGIGGDEFRRQFQVEGTYSQRIERGGKREARVAVADADLDVARAEALVRRLDIAAAVQRLYVEVQAAQATVDITRERVGIAETLEREVGRRVASARDPLFAGTRARTQLAEARVNLELAEHARDAALVRLTALWRGRPGDARIPVGEFLALDRPAGPLAPSATDLAVFEAQARRTASELRLQRANARVDPTWTAGPRFLGTGDIAAVGGVTLPLASRGLNRANIARAEAEARQVEADLAVERFQRQQAITLAAERVEESAHEVEAVRDRVVPGAERTLAEVRAGYNRGGFSFLDVSTAQGALHDARLRMVRAATLHHQARAELDRLTGRFTPLVQGTD